jgi:Fe-S-cluster containining protein
MADEWPKIGTERMRQPTSKPEMLEPWPKGEKIRFACHPGIRCFTDCCRDLHLVLTPYDVLRAKKALGMDSTTFLEQHTVQDTDPTWKIPVVRLKMEDNDTRSCPFVVREGCRIYADRPGACRAYPLARMARRSKDMEGVEEFYYVVREPDCKGFKDCKTWTVREWKENEGLIEYNEMNDVFGELLQAKTESGIEHLSADQIDIFYMGCYDIDSFRRNFLEGPNLDRVFFDCRRFF